MTGTVSPQDNPAKHPEDWTTRMDDAVPPSADDLRRTLLVEKAARRLPLGRGMPLEEPAGPATATLAN
jgi:hypothetical protein